MDGAAAEKGDPAVAYDANELVANALVARGGDFGRWMAGLTRAPKGEALEPKDSNAERFGGLPERVEGDLARAIFAKGEPDPKKAPNPDRMGIGAAWVEDSPSLGPCPRTGVAERVLCIEEVAEVGLDAKRFFPLTFANGELDEA